MAGDDSASSSACVSGGAGVWPLEVRALEVRSLQAGALQVRAAHELSLQMRAGQRGARQSRVGEPDRRVVVVGERPPSEDRERGLYFGRGTPPGLAMPVRSGRQLGVLAG